MSSITIKTCPIPPLKELSETWQTLESNTDNDIFTSWLWIGTWLDLLDHKHNTNLLSFFSGKELVGLVVLVQYKNKKYHLFNISQIYMNELPVNGLNMVIEYNGILIRNGYEEKVYQSFVNYVSSNFNWDEIIFGGIKKHDFNLLSRLFPLETKIIDSSKTKIHDFKLYDEHKQKPDNILSKNKRYQIKRSKKLFENQYGKIMLSVAKNTEDALQYFKSLGQLHTKYWNMKGQQGSYHNSKWIEFHTNLIKKGLPSGNIEIIHIHSDKRTLGYLYNLKKNNKIYNIQSGFDYTDDNRFKPGFLAHWMAIEHYYRNGMASYDLLAGDEPYKDSITNTEYELVWARTYKTNLFFTIESILKNLKQKMKLNGD